MLGENETKGSNFHFQTGDERTFPLLMIQVTVREVDKTRLGQVQGRCRTDSFVLGRITQ